MIIPDFVFEMKSQADKNRQEKLYKKYEDYNEELMNDIAFLYNKPTIK
jgi:Uma2 family endonuclease